MDEVKRFKILNIFLLQNRHKNISKSKQEVRHAIILFLGKECFNSQFLR